MERLSGASQVGTSLVVQWLKLCTFNVGGVGSITGGELAPTCCAIREEGVTEATCCLVYEADIS